MNIEKIKEQYLEYYDKLSPALYRFLVFQTSNSDVASDLLQETFLKTWEYISQGKQVQNFRAFLYQVARNTLTDYRRKKKSHSLDSITETGVDFASDENILQEQISQDGFKYILQNLSILNEQQKQLVILRIVEERSIKEIAEIFQERPNTVSVKIHRALDKLKNHLETKKP